MSNGYVLHKANNITRGNVSRLELQLIDAGLDLLRQYRTNTEEILALRAKVLDLLAQQ